MSCRYVYIYIYISLSTDYTLYYREAAQLHEAWNDEIAFGGIASQWSEQFEAEIKRLEAELDGINLDDPLQVIHYNLR